MGYRTDTGEQQGRPGKICYPFAKKFILKPLSRWLAKDTASVAPAGKKQYGNYLPADFKGQTVVEVIKNLPVESYFNYFNELLADNPPFVADSAIITRMAQVGIGAGNHFSLAGFDAKTQEALNNLTADIYKELDEAYPTREKDRRTTGQGAKTGDYKTDYYGRALVAYKGLGALPPEEAVYYLYEEDRDKEGLDGSKGNLERPVTRKSELNKNTKMTGKTILALLLCIHFSGFAQKLYFPPVNSDEWETVSPQSLHWNQAQIDSLYNYLEQANTKAFLLLKDGKIVLEKYFGNHAKDKLWYWASAGKSLTAFLTGIAQQENHLSITDPVSKYLGEGWTGTTPGQESKITVWNQLTMTSGLNDADNYCTVDSCLTYLAEAGTRWAYHNAPYTLLDSVLQKAAGSTLTGFVQLKLKDKTGITGKYHLVGYNKIFHSTARVMARFGLLILNKGNWNGDRILTDAGFFNQMVNTSQPLNESYGYLWWLNGKSSYMQPFSQKVFEGALIPNAPADMIAALGANGQIIHVVPSRNMVVIRMGDAPNAGASSSLGYEIWEFINRLARR